MHPIATDHACSTPLGAHVGQGSSRDTYTVVESFARKTGPSYTPIGDAFLIKKLWEKDISLVCYPSGAVRHV
jgi:hypothetical protein